MNTSKVLFGSKRLLENLSSDAGPPDWCECHFRAPKPCTECEGKLEDWIQNYDFDLVLLHIGSDALARLFFFSQLDKKFDFSWQPTMLATLKPRAFSPWSTKYARFSSDEIRMRCSLWRGSLIWEYFGRRDFFVRQFLVTCQAEHHQFKKI